MKTLSTIILSLVCATTTMAQTQTVEVLEYQPAPGQYVNTLPTVAENATHADACAEATTCLNKPNYMIHLGTFGGYVTVRFDHAIQNKRGSDILILGNGIFNKDTNGGSIEPGIVYVGVGSSLDDCQWYELAGSEYYTSEIHDFSITYHKPTTEDFVSDYIKWECSWTEKDGTRRDSTGYHSKIGYHKQSYWPYWNADKETMTFSGGKLPNNAKNLSETGQNWVQYRYSDDAYGYVDACAANDSLNSSFDIDWAVDNEGNHVNLSEVNFIRIKTGIFQYCGWLGETSTEVKSITDLHLLAGYDDNPYLITPRTPTSIAAPTAKVTTGDSDDPYFIELTTGLRTRTPSHGIYIRGGKKYIFR